MDNSYGVEEEGMAADKNDYDRVVIPECIFSRREDHFSQLQQEINPLGPSNDYGIDIYLTTCQLIELFKHNQFIYS